jgi:Fur family peroxide stress response transcriptional regulator
MKILIEDIRNKFAEKGLKITPQRVVILEAVYKLNNHPTADNIIEYIRESNPNIATGTVYKVLETLVENGLIKKVTTDKGIMRYDGIVEKHHHIYYQDSDRIEDYFDDELNELLKNYFENKKIHDFKIEDIKLQISGKHIQ